MTRLSEDQQAAVAAFVSAFHAHRQSQAALDAARDRLVGEALRLRRLRVPSAPVARLMADAIGVRPSQQALRALRGLLRTRMSRASAHQRSGASENTPDTSG
jgi:hypothetical protein